MASADSLREHFELLGVDVNEDILAKCIELCLTYHIDAEELADTWLAFSLSSLKGAPPTVENLRLMESKKLFNQKVEVAPVHAEKSASPRVYSAGSRVSDLGYYVAQTPKRSKVDNYSEIVHSPTSGDDYLHLVSSPSAHKSANYSSRENSGAILLAYGVKVDSPEWIGKSGLELKLIQIRVEDGPPLNSSSMFGYDLLYEKAIIFGNHVDYLSQLILEKAKIAETTSVRAKSHVPVTIVGRIGCDVHGRLNKKSVMLKGNSRDSLNHTVQVDLEQLKQFSVFPGQVVAFTGINLRGNHFIAQEIYTDASLPVSKQMPSHDSNGPIQILLASGPFTTSDCLSFEPLMDLAKYISENKPHVVILTGPFLDADHVMLNDVAMNEPFDILFSNIIDSFMSRVNEHSPSTQVILISNSKDIFHYNVYPTPPYNEFRKYSNILCAPDPCTFNINGVVIGVTSSDILMHLCKDEISSAQHSMGKMPRMAGHLISQQCFYPLWPPNSDQPLDSTLWNDHAHMTITPHILVLPSKLRYFVENVNGCIVINPDHLAKGSGGGMFARLRIPTDDSNCSVPSRLSCEVLRI